MEVLVNGSAVRKPGMSGTNGTIPVLITTLVPDSVRCVPASSVTSTVRGPT